MALARQLTLEQIAVILGMSVHSVRRYIRDGRMDAAYKMPGDRGKARWRMDEADLSAWIEEQKGNHAETGGGTP